MTSVTIYHNPACSKSRQTLSILEHQYVDLTVIQYLESPPDAATLTQIIQMLDCSAMDIVRKGESEFGSTGLIDASSDQDVIAAIINHPILMQRPIVVCNGQARIGRPPESVLEILSD